MQVGLYATPFLRVCTVCILPKLYTRTVFCGAIDIPMPLCLCHVHRVSNESCMPAEPARSALFFLWGRLGTALRKGPPTALVLAIASTQGEIVDDAWI